MREEKRIIQKGDLRLEFSMSPFLALLLKLYHMSKLELSEFLKTELQENIFLEEKIERGEEREDEREDFELEELIQGFGDDFSYLKLYEREEELDPLELVEAPPPSFHERMNYQIEYTFKNKLERKIAYAILENLDEGGYLKKSLKELAENVGVSLEKFEEVRQKFMRLDPVGVGARDISECVRVQLEERGEEKEVIEKVVECVQNLCDEKDMESLKKRLNVEEKEIEKILRLVKGVFLQPALKYSLSASEYVYPEVVVVKREGNFIPIIDETGLPRLRLNRKYVNMLNSESLSSEDKKILRRYLQRAVDIFKALVQRKINLLRVAEFIIEKNKDFFEGKTNRIFPLTQGEAAEKLGIKTSTFHKLISGKYMDTPRGIFEMKFFFPGGIKSKSGRISREEVKEIIKEIIDREDKKHPLSDEMISQILQADGIRIKRRTVQKLREEMGIPSSSKRKEI